MEIPFTIESIGPRGQGVVRLPRSRLIIDDPAELLRVRHDIGPNHGSNMLVLEYRDRTVLTLPLSITAQDIDQAIEELTYRGSGNSKQRRRQRREARLQIEWLESLK